MGSLTTSEELRRLSAEDYHHIRNLGRRSIEEIKRKLYELETLTEDSSMNVCNYTDMLNELIGLNEVGYEETRYAAAFPRQRQRHAALTRL